MKRLNVLIVHRDIEESRRAFRKIDWKKLGMQVVYCVTGGDAALGFMRQNHVDIVIADVDAPCAEGDFIRAADERGSGVLLLAVAGPEGGRDGMIRALCRENVYTCLSAGLDPAETARALRSAGRYWRGWHIANAVGLLDLDMLFLPPEVKNDIRGEIRDILRDAQGADFDQLIRDVSVLFHKRLAPSIPGGAELARAAAMELLLQLKYQLMATGTECGREFALNALLDQVCCAQSPEDLEDICLHYLQQSAQPQSGGKGRKQLSSVVRTAMQVIRQKYPDPDFTLASLANDISISPNYLSSVFRLETGVRFKTYLNSFRIERAKELLMDGRYRIYEVSSLVGIEDSRYFSQIFRTYTGMKPSEFCRSPLFAPGENKVRFGQDNDDTNDDN